MVLDFLASVVRMDERAIGVQMLLPIYIGGKETIRLAHRSRHYDGEAVHYLERSRATLHMARDRLGC